jgi:hypothetical protein
MPRIDRPPVTGIGPHLSYQIWPHGGRVGVGGRKQAADVGRFLPRDEVRPSLNKKDADPRVLV